MKDNIKDKKWRIFWYATYGIFLLVLLLYIRFPSEAFKDYLQSGTGSLDLPFRLSVDSVSPSLPFGLVIEKADISPRGDHGWLQVRADSIRLRPLILSFLKGDFKYRFRCSAYGGAISGEIQFLKRVFGGPFVCSLDMRQVRIDKGFIMPSLIGDRMGGTLDGTLTFSLANALPKDGNVKADLTVSKGQIRLARPFLGLESLNFDQLLLRMEMKEQDLNLQMIELRGKDIRGTASGSIYMEKEFQESGIDLRGSLEPSAGLYRELTAQANVMGFLQQRLKSGKLNIEIKGTIQNPSINFI